MFWLQNDLSKGQGNDLQSERGREETDGQVGASATISIISDKDRQRQKRQTKTDKEEEVNDNHILTLSALLESRKNVIIPSGIFSKVLPLIKCLHLLTF